MSAQTYRYSATVNGKRRAVVFTVDLDTYWADAAPLDAARLYVDNTHKAYETFYRGAR